jgi:para-nitrobenzyl esterase
MKKLNAVLALLLIVLFPVLTKAQGNADAVIAGKNVAVVETDLGKLRGYIHNGIFTYKGIAYAVADRFMPPAKPAAWKDTRTALTYGPVCPTDPTTTVNDIIEFPFDHNWGYPNEHCQTLNVWTPRINDQKKRPVMVWLHGGGFTAGSSVELPSYDGESLSRKGDVVVVSLNHRLNVLGFLDLSAYGNKYKYSSNAGLMDIIMALQWIRNNIAQFGGDPDNVTVFGQSGGGGKVTCLMSSPAAKGLFHKAIVESGSYLSRSSFQDPAIAKRVTAALLAELQLQPSQVDSLQTIPYERLNAAGKKALRKVQEELKAEGKTVGGFGLGWGPILDGDILPYQADDPSALELSKDVPLLVGSVKNEFGAFMPGINDLTMEQVKSQLEKRYGQNADAFMAAVQKAYPNTSKPSQYIDVDVTFRPGVIHQASQKVQHGTAPVYMYLFTWQSPVNDGMYKAMHCMELPFVFNNIKRCEQMTGGGKEAYALADKMSSAWISFARSGNPNAPGLPKWPAYTPENGTLMIFDNACVTKSHHDDELLKLASAPKL